MNGLSSSEIEGKTTKEKKVNKLNLLFRFHPASKHFH